MVSVQLKAAIKIHLLKPEISLGYILALFPVLPRAQLCYALYYCGEDCKTGKAWSETSREVDVG